MTEMDQNLKTINCPYVAPVLKEYEIDVDSLHPLLPEILQKQATCNIGTLGHVSHGKSTLVEGISSIKPIKFHQEQERNITIKLGYANFKVYKCDKCPKPECYHSEKSSFHAKDGEKAEAPCPNFKQCGGTMHLVRHFSFVDCPGHDCLMATMLNGAAVMDAALLLIAANQAVPQPQTAEHLAAAEVMKLKNIITVQSKLDLVKEEEAYKNYSQIQEFVKNTVAEKSPVVPLSCTPKQKINVDVILQYLCEMVPVPNRDFKSPPQLTIVRSFDVNQPGTEFTALKGGVAGGTLKKGILKVGQRIEIRPGIIIKDDKGTLHCKPLYSVVVSLFSEQNSLQYAVPGGLIAVGTKLDPTLTKGDRLVGQVIGAVGTLPDVYVQVEASFTLFHRVIGARSETEGQKPEKVHKPTANETLMVNIGSTSTTAKVVAVKKDAMKLTLSKPCCVEIGEGISISRRVKDSWRLIGCGTITHGVPLVLEANN